MSQARSCSRYVYVCPGCDGLHVAVRIDTVYCTRRCAERIKRHPELRARVVRVAADHDLEPFQLMELQAVARLRPDLLDAIGRGVRTVADVRDDVFEAYTSRLAQAVLALELEQPT
jgi:hypothetical protein